jgi:hypothetical protein
MKAGALMGYGCEEIVGKKFLGVHEEGVVMFSDDIGVQVCEDGLHWLKRRKVN